MASWLGYSTTTWTSASPTISIPLITSSSSTANGTIPSAETSTNALSLLSLCKSVTPPCHLSPLLPGGHVQTLYGAVSRRPICELHYKRRIFTSDSSAYPGCFAVDFVSRTPASPDTKTVNPRTTEFSEAEWARFCADGSVDGRDAEAAAKRPILVALHGISGGSHELYLREVLDPLVSGAEVEKGRGTAIEWDALVVNGRGCANSPVTGDRLFNARASWDCKQFVQWLSETFPGRKIFGVGFSLGANILTNYLGEEGVNTPMSAAVINSNPWNLEAGSLALERTWIGRELYSKALCAGLQKLVKKNVKSIERNPRVDIKKLQAAKYLFEFDRDLQGPTWGYPTVGAYYRDASSTEAVLSVRIPSLALHADDDPVAPSEALPYEEVKCNPYVVLCCTSMGGHLSWFESGGSRWFVKPTVNFLRKMADEVDLNSLRGQAKSEKPVKASSTNGEPFFDPMRRKLHTPLPGPI